jgi:type VI secretion system protein ImpB
MAESFQKRRNRQRPTRVNISYDVEVGDAIVKKEIPFIMGVMADLSGDGASELAEPKDRKFVDIGPENFDEVLKASNAKLAYSVDNKLSDKGGKLGVSVKFESFEDFSPDKVAEQVEPLKELLAKRRQLTDLKSKLTTNYKLDQALQAALGNEENMKRLKTELGSKGGSDGNA